MRDIKIAGNAIIPVKEHTAGQRYHPLRFPFRSWNRRAGREPPAG